MTYTDAMSIDPLIVVGCGKAKQPLGWRGPIVDLYVGSYYRAVLAYAQSLGGPHCVLSALHGACLPSHEVTRYERRLAGDRASRDAFAASALRFLRDATREGGRVVVLAGNAYHRDWADELRAEGRLVETPLAGMGIGLQKRWLASQQR